LKGRVRIEPGNLVVQVELIEAVTGRQLWGEVYREKLDYTRLAEAEQKLAKEIADKVKDKLIE